ncbi:hypothetical protein DFH05DRAFT_1473272 [Lentinula detonsa]|uniref:DUF6533 domain-containing protein n=1 Tax=Lentinula detonsa TaxID=2804962 RepID=A0A9W8U1D4_9AGAR|nr:hypothetical protein DFH05DRAFT_1473272 [Lentinula detonsa]
MMSQYNAAEIQTQVNWNHYVELIEFVILVYDYILTFDIEIERFWKHNTKRLAPILFFINRYLTLFGNLVLVIFFFWPEPILRHHNGRESMDFFAQGLVFAVQFNISVLFFLRVDAIYGGSRRIAGIFGLVLFATVVNDVVQLYLTDRTGAAAVDPPSALAQVGSIPSFSNTQGLPTDFAYLWIGIFVLDICVIILTLWKTVHLYRSGYVPGGIGALIMRDGLMYFGVITLATLANILAFALGTEFTKGLLPIFTNIICSVMMSRLMLNLREDNLNFETQISGLIFAHNTTHDSPPTTIGEHSTGLEYA